MPQDWGRSCWARPGEAVTTMHFFEMDCPGRSAAFSRCCRRWGDAPAERPVRRPWCPRRSGRRCGGRGGAGCRRGGSHGGVAAAAGAAAAGCAAARAGRGGNIGRARRGSGLSAGAQISDDVGPVLDLEQTGEVILVPAQLRGGREIAQRLIGQACPRAPHGVGRSPAPAGLSRRCPRDWGRFSGRPGEIMAGLALHRDLLAHMRIGFGQAADEPSAAGGALTVRARRRWRSPPSRRLMVLRATSIWATAPVTIATGPPTRMAPTNLFTSSVSSRTRANSWGGAPPRRRNVAARLCCQCRKANFRVSWALRAIILPPSRMRPPLAASRRGAAKCANP